MDELLQRVAEIRGMPASLIQRSAQARAEKEGITVEAVLTEWAGEEAAPEPAPAGSSTVAEETPSTDADSDESDSTSNTAAPVEITTDYLVQLAADAKRMPPRLILSSATARAEHGNTTLELVLADWAGRDLDELRASAASGEAEEASEPPEEALAEPADSPEPSPAKEAVTAAAAVGAVLTMDELLEKVVEVKGMPASLAKRSAEARSKKTGEAVEAVLADWAGVDVSAVAEAPEDETDVEESQKPDEEPATAPEEPDEPESEGPEVIEAEAPEIEEPPEDEAPIVRGGYPRWLAAAFVLIPLLAVTYILVAPNGPDCGTAGQLLVDQETGIALNCDGSEYGTNVVDYMAVGAGIYTQCVACHSADGSGGAGPAFSGGALLSTFPAGACNDHIEWVSIGTAGWSEPTYGATDKPVGGFGLMPAFGTSLTEEQLASVALYERVEFAGQPLEEAQIDCGLVEETEDDATTTEAAGS